MSAGIWAEGAIASKDYRFPRREQGSPPQNRGVLPPTVSGAASRAQALPAVGTDIGTRHGQKQRWHRGWGTREGTGPTRGTARP